MSGELAGDLKRLLNPVAQTWSKTNLVGTASGERITRPETLEGQVGRRLRSGNWRKQREYQAGNQRQGELNLALQVSSGAAGAMHKTSAAQPRKQDHGLQVAGGKELPRIGQVLFTRDTYGQ